MPEYLFSGRQPTCITAQKDSVLSVLVDWFYIMVSSATAAWCSLHSCITALTGGFPYLGVSYRWLWKVHVFKTWSSVYGARGKWWDVREVQIIELRSVGHGLAGNAGNLSPFLNLMLADLNSVNGIPPPCTPAMKHCAAPRQKQPG